MASNPARVLWKRLPTYFPNIKLQLQPLSEEQLSTLMKTGHLDQAVFRTTPNVTKQEIREVLQKVYQIPVTSIHTAIYEGKKVRRGRRGQQLAKKPDYKKVWVNMMNGTLTQETCPTEMFPKEDRTKQPPQMPSSP